MAQAEQLDLLKVLLKVNFVEDPGRRCQQLYEHGVTTLSQFAELSVETLVKWGIADNEYGSVCIRALPHAQALLRDSSHDLELATIKQQLLVRARMHYIHLCVYLL